MLFKYEKTCKQDQVTPSIKTHFISIFPASGCLRNNVCISHINGQSTQMEWLHHLERTSEKQIPELLCKYEGRLKNSWSGGSAPRVCCYASNCMTAAHCRQSTKFSNGSRSCSVILKSVLLK
jgi:hypothetical protein